jgi:hypothetical protein
MPKQPALRSVKRIFLLLLGSNMAIAALGAGEDPLTRASLEKSFFRAVRVQPGEPPQLVLQFKDSGARFLCLRNEEEEKVNDYGETMSVKPGETFSLNQHHGILEFRPLPKPLQGNGWLIESAFDARSFGGGITTRYGIILIVGTPAAPDLQFVEPEKGFDPKLPPSDPTFQKVLSIVAGVDPLARHDLIGETATGDQKAPFPTSLSAVHFRWQKKAGASPHPLEVRWIAENVRGADKNHLIATTKSDADKPEGEFSLKKPAAGFPPGRYRIELWQGGKMIYSEKFEIKPD